MKLKKKINKAAYDALSAELKALYAGADDEYTLDIDGEEDTGPLKRAFDRSKAEAQELKDRLAEIEREKEELARADALKNKDVATLQKQWKADQDKAVKEVQDKLEQATKFINKQLGDSVAEQLAASLTDSPGLLLPHLRGRIGVNTEGGDFKTVILDANGQPTDKTLEDLGTEFRSNKDFSVIMRASKASGAAPASKPAAAPGATTQKPDAQNPDGLSTNYTDIGREMAERFKNDPEFNAE